MCCCRHFFSILAKFFFYKRKSEAAASSWQGQFCLRRSCLVTQMRLEYVNIWQALSTFSVWMRNWWVNSSVQQRFLMVMPKPFTSSFPVQMDFYRNRHINISTAIKREWALFKYWKQYKDRKQVWESFVESCVWNYVRILLWKCFSLFLHPRQYTLPCGQQHFCVIFSQKNPISKAHLWKLELYRV